jgi:hypothetical protein
MLQSQAIDRTFGIALAVGAVLGAYSDAAITSDCTESGLRFPLCVDYVRVTIPLTPEQSDPTVPAISVEHQSFPCDTASRQSDGRSKALDDIILSHVMAGGRTLQISHG